MQIRKKKERKFYLPTYRIVIPSIAVFLTLVILELYEWAALVFVFTYHAFATAISKLFIVLSSLFYNSGFYIAMSADFWMRMLVSVYTWIKGLLTRKNGKGK